MFIILCGLRCWAGGVHCPTRGTCLLAMIALCFISLVAGSFFRKLGNWSICCFMGTLHSDFMVKGTWKNENSAIVRSRRESSKKVYSILFCGGLILLSLLLTKSNWRGIIVISALLESLSILPCKRNKI